MARRRLKKSASRSWAERLKHASVITQIAIATAIITGVTGSIAGINAAYPIVEPYFYVPRYVLRLVMDRQSTATDRQTLFQLQEYLDRAKKDPAAAKSPIVQQRIIDLTKQITDTEERLRKAASEKR